jgi:hypothetical protein
VLVLTLKRIHLERSVVHSNFFFHSNNKSSHEFLSLSLFFLQGAERLAYMFHEIKPKSAGRGWVQVGGSMVAKESRFIEDEESKEAFHLSFCRVQKKSNELAKLFNQAVEKAPLLLPSRDEASPPPIVFLECSVYEYTNFHGDKCGLLVGMYIA